MMLMQGDCLKMMSHIDSGTVDMVLADPPYGTTKCAWDSVIDVDLMWKELKRVCKPNSAIVLTAAQPFTSILVSSNLPMFRYDWVWEKGNATGFFNAKKMPLRAHESILVFYDKLPTYNPVMTHGHKRKTAGRKEIGSEVYGKGIKKTIYDSTSRYPRSVQKFSRDTQTKKLHPTQKPELLMSYLVQTYSNKGETVLDFCMGSGTTGVVCERLRRDFVGIEVDENYFDIARNRILEARNELSA